MPYLLTFANSVVVQQRKLSDGNEVLAEKISCIHMAMKLKVFMLDFC